MREARPTPASLQRPPPLLCFLHGLGEAAPLEIQTAMSLHGPLREGNPEDMIDRMVVLAPQLPEAGDHWHRYADAVRGLVLSMTDRGGCDPARLYLTGFSYGGNGAFDLAIAHPELWAAFWAVDPTRVPVQEIRAPVFVSFGDIARAQAQLYIKRLGLAPSNSDAAFAEDVTVEARAGLGTHLWKDDGLDHVATARSAYRDAAIYRWLLNQRRLDQRPA
jgi:predicted peptidase